MVSIGFSARWAAYARAQEQLSDEPLALMRIVGAHRTMIDARRVGFDGALADESAMHISLENPQHNTKQEEYPPVVGDWIAARELDTPQDRAQQHDNPALRWAIVNILPRQSLLERPSVARDSSNQRITANIDIALIVEPMQPEPSLSRVERLAAVAIAAGVEPWIVCSKSDLVSRETLQAWREQLERRFQPVFAISAQDASSTQALYDAIPASSTLIMLGRSGGGKSTLANAMLAGSIATPQKVQSVRQVDAKGRHTTTNRSLLMGERFALIDNPGIRAVGAAASAQSVDSVFADIVAVARQCRFSDCSHRTEPGCAVKEAVRNGSLHADDVERFLAMRAESERNQARGDARMRRMQERKASKSNTSGRKTMMHLKGKW